MTAAWSCHALSKYQCCRRQGMLRTSDTKTVLTLIAWGRKSLNTLDTPKTGPVHRSGGADEGDKGMG